MTARVFDCACGAPVCLQSPVVPQVVAVFARYSYLPVGVWFGLNVVSSVILPFPTCMVCDGAYAFRAQLVRPELSPLTLEMCCLCICGAPSLVHNSSKSLVRVQLICPTTPFLPRCVCFPPHLRRHCPCDCCANGACF